MAIRAITFDLDNTLWDVEAPLLRAEAAQRAWFEAHRPNVIELLIPTVMNEIRKELVTECADIHHSVTAMRREFIHRVQLRAGYSEADSQVGTDGAFSEFLAVRQQVELFEDVADTLRTLAASYTLGALTNGNADVFKTEAGEFMDFAFLAEEVGAGKPDPALFEAAIAKTSLQASQILHVGDSPDHDIDGAHAVGLRTAWINPDNKAWAKGKAPLLTLRHVRELPEAIALINGDSSGSKP